MEGPIRILTTGIGGWLSYESACNRSGLFSERYLTTAVGQILSGRSGGRTVAEWTHPVLAAAKTGSGRPPQVDFVVLDENKKPITAIESKWAGRSLPSTEAIVWDLVRLELIASQFGARCFFLLAGKRYRVEKVFEGPGFTVKDWANPNRLISVLGFKPVTHKLWLAPRHPGHIPMLKKVFDGRAGVDIPEYVSTRRAAAFPANAPADHYQVHVWEIVPALKRNTFRPENSPKLKTVLDYT